MPMTCQQCGEQNADGSLMCGMCGAVLKAPEAPVKTAPRPGPVNRPMPAPPPTGARPGAAIPPTPPVRRPMQQRRQYTEYAGVGTRFVALLIDSFLLLIPIAIIGVTTSTRNAQGELVDSSSLPIRLLPIVFSWLYFALMDSSSLQGTLGKLALGLKVTDLNEERISFGRATGRFFSRYLSSLFLGIGYIMAFFTEKNQALHDMIAGTVVLKKVQ